MKEFLAVYTGTPESLERSGWNALDAAVREDRSRQGIQAWTAWVESNRERIVVKGGPLGKTRRVTTAGIADARNNLCAWIVVRANSLEAAAHLFEGHPHFALFPGDGVEIIECLPNPGA